MTLKIGEKMLILKTLKDFAENTSIHGPKLVADTKFSVKTRVIWAIIFTLFLVFASLRVRDVVLCKSYLFMHCGKKKRHQPMFGSMDRG